MGRNYSKVPPVQIEWGDGDNALLCDLLDEFVQDNTELTPDFKTQIERLVHKIKTYGRVKEDENGKKYDSCYFYDNEAAWLIVILTYALLYKTIQPDMDILSAGIDAIRFASAVLELAEDSERYADIHQLVGEFLGLDNKKTE